MKKASSIQQLENRGFVTEEQEQTTATLTESELLEWLKDTQPAKRTLAARRLAKLAKAAYVEPLCLALEKEKALYSKLAICDALASFGSLAVPYLAARLGLIGSNQHKKPANQRFRKKSYPLPRDIAARTLIRIGDNALPELCNILSTKEVHRVSEAVDAIGYICFYSTEKHDDIRLVLESNYQLYADSDLVRWKLLRAMSAFTNSVSFLQTQLERENSMELKQEIERSLALLAK